MPRMSEMDKLFVVFLSAEFSGTFIHLKKMSCKPLLATCYISDPEGGNNQSAMASVLPELSAWNGREVNRG